MKLNEIDAETLNEMFLIQDNRCDLCGVEFSEDINAHLSFKSDTLEILGLVCDVCNQNLKDYVRLRHNATTFENYLNKNMVSWDNDEDDKFEYY